MLRHLFSDDEEAPPQPAVAQPIRRLLLRDAQVPTSMASLNQLPHELKQRVIRLLIPPRLLVAHAINPVSWEAEDEGPTVSFAAEPDSNRLHVSACASADRDDPFFVLELQDTQANGLRLNLLVLNDPATAYFPIDRDADGLKTYYGMLRRNRQAEQQAMQAGLAPAQVRRGLGASAQVLQQLESFVVFTAHTAYVLEPLTYAAAWLFERRGLAYIRGNALMKEIHHEFLPGGRLHAALDDSTPFRRPGQWKSIRGRAWAIHDGILAAIDQEWNAIRMIKRVGRDAGVDSMPDVVY